jgi:hypothetical protein
LFLSALGDGGRNADVRRDGIEANIGNGQSLDLAEPKSGPGEKEPEIASIAT